MGKKPLIGVSILAVVLLVWFMSNVVGYQSSRPHNRISSKRESTRGSCYSDHLRFANDKEIQRIIIKSQMSRGFPANQKHL